MSSSAAGQIGAATKRPEDDEESKKPTKEEKKTAKEEKENPREGREGREGKAKKKTNAKTLAVKKRPSPKKTLGARLRKQFHTKIASDRPNQRVLAQQRGFVPPQTTRRKNI